MVTGVNLILYNNLSGIGAIPSILILQRMLTIQYYVVPLALYGDLLGRGGRKYLYPFSVAIVSDIFEWQVLHTGMYLSFGVVLGILNNLSPSLLYLLYVGKEERDLYLHLELYRRGKGQMVCGSISSLFFLLL